MFANKSMMQAPKLTNEGKIRNKFYDVLFFIKPRFGDFFLLHFTLEIFYANHTILIYLAQNMSFGCLQEKG